MEVVELSENVRVGCGAASGEHVESALLEDHILKVGVSHHFNASHALSSYQVRVTTFFKHRSLQSWLSLLYAASGFQTNIGEVDRLETALADGRLPFRSDVDRHLRERSHRFKLFKTGQPLLAETDKGLRCISSVAGIGGSGDESVVGRSKNRLLRPQGLLGSDAVVGELNRDNGPSRPLAGCLIQEPPR